MDESSLNVHQLVVDDANHILVTFNIDLLFNLLDVVVEDDAGISELNDGFFQIS